MSLFSGRETSFYGSPVTKGLVFTASTSTLIYSVASTAVTNETTSIWLSCLKSISFPSTGIWAMGVVIMYWTRPLERRLGSSKFVHILLSSCLLAGFLFLSFNLSPLSYTVPPGNIIFWILGVLLTYLMLTVRGSRISQHYGVRLSSHIVPLLIITFMLSSFPIALPSFLCGVIGSIITNTFKPFPLPYFIINQLVSVITKLTSEKPPRLLSGATLDVQRQQHMDLLEAFVLNMQQRQVQPTGVPYIPGDAQVRQLTMMGFRWDEARHALISAHGDITGAIQILTTNRL